MSWDQMNVEYAAKGWPLIDPSSPDYCYQPCENGLHVCGFHPDGNNFLTIANITTSSPEAARALFERAKAEFAVEPDAEGDFVVDLQQDDGCCEDFQMHRQMLDRLLTMQAEQKGGA